MRSTSRSGPPPRFTVSFMSEGWGKLPWYLVLDHERPVVPGLPREVARCINQHNAANVCAALNFYNQEMLDALNRV